VTAVGVASVAPTRLGRAISVHEGSGAIAISPDGKTAGVRLEPRWRFVCVGCNEQAGHVTLVRRMSITSVMAGIHVSVGATVRATRTKKGSGAF
jgi:hypothetical protein